VEDDNGMLKNVFSKLVSREMIMIIFLLKSWFCDF